MLGQVAGKAECPDEVGGIVNVLGLVAARSLDLSHPKAVEIGGAIRVLDRNSLDQRRWSFFQKSLGIVRRGTRCSHMGAKTIEGGAMLCA